LPVHQVAEIVIAGAGMAGAAAAYQLAVRAGVSRVVLVDPREPLTLTSNKGTEGYRNYWPDDTMRRFMERSIDLLDALDRDSGEAFELNRRGYVFLTADSDEAERLSRYDGALAQFVDGSQRVRARFPFVTDRVLAMLHIRRAGFMNAVKLGQWLLARAHEHGVQLVHDEVTRLLLGGGRLTGVELESGTRIEARAFVLAAGPRLAEWVTRLDLDVSILNEPHGKIAFDDDAAVIPRDIPLMIWNDAVELSPLGTFPPGVHLRARGARSLLGLWTYDTRIEPPSFPPVFAEDFPDIVMRGLAAMVPALAPHIPRAREAIVDGGYYCKTPDNRPLIGATSIEGVYLVGALSGYGIMASQAAAELLAAHLLDGPLPAYADAFRPGRFGDPAYQSTLATLNVRSGQL
jgi:glycine/D-amino acid oxidase-like deaminating enzyme